MDTANLYWNAIPLLEAQEKLNTLHSADWPNIKKSDRKKIWRDLNRTISKEFAAGKPESDMDDLALKLNRMING